LIVVWLSLFCVLSFTSLLTSFHFSVIYREILAVFLSPHNVTSSVFTIYSVGKPDIVATVLFRVYLSQSSSVRTGIDLAFSDHEETVFSASTVFSDQAMTLPP
jgi:hypothetical protein